MKLQAGKCYKTRLGKTVGPIEMNEYGLFRSPDRSAEHEFWYLNGRYALEDKTSLDLVEEFAPPPETTEYYVSVNEYSPVGYVPLLTHPVDVIDSTDYIRVKLVYFGSDDWNLLELHKNSLDSATKPGHNDLPPAGSNV